jgi:hypothetical protein
VHLSMTTDEAVLRQLVGTTTFVRGRDYARSGAVVSPQFREGGGHVFGQVRGSSRTPYSAIAIVAKSAEGTLTSFRGTCTCPVRANCKHAVALLLVTLPGETSEDGAGAAPPAAWERSLIDLVGNDPQELSDPALALQFEIADPCVRPPGSPRPVPPQLGMRPVLRGRNGGWVRAGISWSNIGYVSCSRRGLAPEHLRLFNEILAMDSSRSSTYYGGPSRAIYLESIDSRRIWDLLAEAGTLGLPLVHAGRRALPVTLYPEAADLVMDVSRSRRGLILRPQIRVGEERPTLDAALLLGNPAHGIAWWQAAGEDAPLPTSSLRLARLSAPLDSTLRHFFDRRPLVVPRQDEGRFFSQYYPALRQRVRLASGDESVALPEPGPPTLSLVICHLDGHRLSLDWRWLYSVGDAVRQEPLWPPHASATGRDLAEETAVLAGVGESAGAMPELCEASPGGSRLAPSATLEGLATVRFSTDVLPRLAELPELTIETHGSPVNYREAESPPVVAISGSQSPGDRDWFDLAVAVSIDGEEVCFERLFVALSSGETHLILPSGTYFPLDGPQLRGLVELIAEARSLQDPGSETVRISRYQASLWEDLDRLGVISGQAAEWQRSVRALTRLDALAQQPVPETLHADLRAYQLVGFSWLSFLYTNRLGGILADEMGLGKTLQTLALFCHAKEARDTNGPFLVVAPTSVTFNWAAECSRFAPGLDVRVVSETCRRRGSELASVAAGADVVITSYALFRIEYDDYAGLEWSGLVLDEAQFVKNHQARGHKCAKKLKAPFKLAITGTPMENNLMELWSLLSITAPGLFASPSRFDRHYRTPIEKGENPGRLGQLRRRVKPLMLRRSKEQVVRDLPDKQEQVLELALNPKHERFYQTHLHRERQKVLGLLGDLEKNRFEIFRSLTLLRQASLDAALIDPAQANVPSTKLDNLMELLTEIVSEGHRTLVFSQFTRFLDAARRRVEAAGIDHCYLDGSTRNRAGVLAEFKGGSAPVFFISLKAGGFGLNLSEADYCILLDPWWNPATEAQAVDRVHRIGQTKPVMVYRLLAKNTIEEKVMALKAAKAALFGSVLDDGEFASGSLTAADIRGMLE